MKVQVSRCHCQIVSFRQDRGCPKRARASDAGSPSLSVNLNVEPFPTANQYIRSFRRPGAVRLESGRKHKLLVPASLVLAVSKVSSRDAHTPQSSPSQSRTPNTMPPPRYGQQSMNSGYHMQQSHLQHNPTQQHGALPPPNHLATPSFGAGSSQTSPFNLPGNISSNFDRDISGAGMLPGQVAQMGFPRGGPVQSHQNYDSLPIPRANKDDARIRNVWRQNLKQELETLRQLVDTYPYIAMVTHRGQ